MTKRKSASVPSPVMYVTLKGPVASPAPEMYVTLKGPIASPLATAKGKHRPGGRPRRITAAAVKAEKQRRTKDGKLATYLALARHFEVSPKTISRRLKKR